MDKSNHLSTVSPLANRAAIKVVLFWVATSILVGQAIILILFFQQGLTGEMIILGVGLVPVLIGLELNRRDHSQLAGIIMAVSLTCMITMLATIGYGIYDISIMAYPAILIIVSLILSRNTTIYLTAFMLVCVGWLVFGNLYGVYEIPSPQHSFARQFAVAAIVLIVTCVAVLLLSDLIRKNVAAIRHELEERARIEKTLRETEELYRNMVENTSVITYRDTAEIESSTIYISPQIQDVLGFSQDKWQTNPKFWMEIIHPEDLPDVLANIAHYLGTGQKTISEYRMRTRDGHWLWFQDESMVVKDADGHPQYIHGVLIDITERKNAEQKLKQREAILSAVAQTAQQLLKSADWHNEIKAILKLLGEATGASHTYIFENHQGPDGIMLSSQTYEWVAPGMKSELGNPVYQDSRLNPTSPGLEDWYTNLSSGIPFYGSGQQYPRFWKRVFEESGLKTLLDMPILVNGEWWGIIGFDDFSNEMPWSQAEIDALMAAAGNLGTAISRQQADSALRASEEKFQLAFHRTFVPMVISRAHDQVILDVNEAFCKGIGFARAEILGKTGRELNLWVDLEAQRRHLQLVAEHGFHEEFKAEFRRKSGETGVALISAIKIRLGIELCLLHTLYDISKIEELLKELKAKNEELQTFTYTVSHDLRAPLVTISGFMGYLEEDAKNGNLERVQRNAQRINQAVIKMERLLSELLELSRIGRIMNIPSNVPLAEIVRDALQILDGRLAAKAINVNIQPQLPMVYGDRVRLTQVVQNLVENAAKFMGAQTQPTIEIGMTQAGNPPAFFVRDNGAGIESDQQEKIFGLFNKLDMNSEGTGIGLALVRRIIEVHGGKIWVESAGKGKGSTFYFTLAQQPGTQA